MFNHYAVLSTANERLGGRPDARPAGSGKAATEEDK
jgi:hypothetical protein